MHQLRQSSADVYMVGADEDPVGPQNWYKEAGGQPAQALPKEDVGPHLPPGGECLPTPPPLCLRLSGLLGRSLLSLRCVAVSQLCISSQNKLTGDCRQDCDSRCSQKQILP